MDKTTHKLKITTDKALIISWSILLLYTIICEVQLFLGIEPNDTLTMSLFATFGAAEGGYCMYIHTKDSAITKFKDALINTDIEEIQ